MNDTWKNNSTPVKVSAIVMFLAMVYLFVYDGESFTAWTVFFITLGATVLFKVIDEQHTEIQGLRNRDKKTDEDIQVIFHQKNPTKQNHDDKQS